MTAPQQTIGPYRIVSKLGEGGMGEVWRATDTRLNREVAIKVLPAAVAGDAMRLARFTREAQVLASLNHPNVAAIYGVEERALVMELVEGPTLAERIGGRAMPLEEVLGLARQMAEALGYAHDKGVVHRDLKPANIKVTPEGTVKILDFGLAKAMSTESSASSASAPGEAVTQSSAATLPGTVLGTAAYMAPEQARGQNVDRRADVWAFGVVLYEMLTGERPFGGPTISDTLAAVLKEAPDWERVPTGARPLLRACLEKDPKRRLQAVQDGMLLLAASEATAGAAPAPSPRSLAALWTLRGIAVAAIVLAAALGILYWRERPLPPLATASSLEPPAGAAFEFEPTHPLMAVAPNGQEVVFSAADADGTSYLWLRRLDALTPQRLSGTAGASDPFWSPDGSAIGFGQNEELMRLDLAGGTPVPLASAPDLWGASWSSRGVIVYQPTGSATLMQVPAGSGAATPAAASGTVGLFPSFLPDGRHFLFAQSGGAIVLGALGSSSTRVLVQGANSAAIYASGFLLFQQDHTLMAQRFDAAHLTLSGSLSPIGAVSTSNQLDGQFSASSNGVLVLLPSGAAGTLSWYNPSGKLLGTVANAADAYAPSLSPDGHLILLTIGHDLWIFDLASGTRTQFTFGGKSSLGIWSPDGRQIVFGSNRSGRWALYRKPADGSARAQLLYDGGANLAWPSSWSPDGTLVLAGPTVYRGGGASVTPSSSPCCLAMISLAPGSAPGAAAAASSSAGARASSTMRWFVPADRAENGQLSPDGHWIAFEGTGTGHQDEIYITPFPNAGGLYRVSQGGVNFEPRWSRDGKRLYYVDSSDEIMAASVQTHGTTATVGAPQPLFGPVLPNPVDTYDVSADGQRILAIKGNAVAPAMTLIQHWPQVLGH